MISHYIKKRFISTISKFLNIRINNICIGLITGISANFNILLLLIILPSFFIIRPQKAILLIIFILVGYLISFKYKESIQIENQNFINSQYSVISGVVITEPKQKDYDKEIIIKVTNLSTYLSAKVEKYYPIKIFDEINFTGNISEFNTSEFDFDLKSYNLSRKVSLEVKNIKIVSKTTSSDVFSFLKELKFKFEDSINQALHEPDSSLVNGILFGQSDYLPQDLKDNLKVTGIYHIISISGFNVSIIFTTIFLVTKILFNRRISILISLAIVILFMYLIGIDNLPVVRATIMLLYTYTGLYLGTKVNTFTSLLISTTLLLVIYPYYILNISLLLSTFATFGILLTGRLSLPYLKLNIIKGLIDDLKVSLSAIAGTSFITYLSFGNINFTGIITNFFVLPFIPLIMFFGALLIILQSLKISLAEYLIEVIIHTILSFFYSITNLIAQNVAISSNNLLTLFIIIFIFILIDYKIYQKKYI